MKKTLQYLALGTLLALSPIQNTLIAQQEGIPIRIARMSDEEARNKLKYIGFEIGELEKISDQEIKKKIDNIENSLYEIIKQNDNREIRYNAHFFLSRTSFENEKRGITLFTKTFSLLEKCLIEYSQEEEKSGLVAGALEKISNRVSNEERLLSTIRCYELSKISQYPKKNIEKTKSNLDNILNKDIGNLPLKEALEEMFSKEIHTSIPTDSKEIRILDITRIPYIEEIGAYLAPIPIVPGLNLPDEDLKDVTIFVNSMEIVPAWPASIYSSTNIVKAIKNMNEEERKIFPKLNIEHLKLIEEEEYKNQIPRNQPHLIYKHFSIDMVKIFSKWIKKESEEDFEDVKRELQWKGIWTSSTEIRNYRKGCTGIAFLLKTPPGITIKDIFKWGNVDPYNCIYKDVKIQDKNLIDIDW